MLFSRRKRKRQLSEGLKANKRLQESFYHFLYEKNFDWGIILAAFTIVLPCFTGHAWYFLVLKLLIFFIMIYMIKKYLSNWNQLREYYKIENKWNDLRDKSVDIEKLNLDSATTLMEDLKVEFLKIPEKHQKKKSMYKNFLEYIKYDKVDFLQVEKIMNKDPEATKSVFIFAWSIFIILLKLRVVPIIEYSNYRRIQSILLLTVIFFVVYTVENWFGK